MSGPLTGLTVVDLTHALAGPYCTMMLADLGMSVIKVEFKDGDLTRAAGPFAADDAEHNFGGYFQSVNRGKQSIVLNLKDAADMAVLRDLLIDADIMVENFAPGVADRLGLSYDEVSALNPRLVYGSLSGFGKPEFGQSSYQSWPAFDIVVQAMAGLLSITGNEDGTPIKVGPGVGDIFPGALLALGIVAAALETQRSGVGQLVDVAMYDAILSLCERIVYQESYTGNSPVPEGNKHPLLSPFDILQAKDGWVAIAAPNDARWRVLCQLIGRPELADDARLMTNIERVRHRDTVYSVLSEWVAPRTRAEILETLAGHVPVGDVRNAREILNDPHVAARNMAIALEQPGSEQTVRVAGQPIKFSRTPAVPATRAPLLNEHSATIRAAAAQAATHRLTDAELCEELAQIDVTSAPREAVDAAIDCVIDVIGVTLGARSFREKDGSNTHADFRRIVTAEGPCTEIGFVSTGSPRSSALVNGMAGHLLDYDDWLACARIHPSAPLFPAVFAAAEAANADGARFLTAFLAGFEGQGRIGAATAASHYDSGWHQTATIGTFGAALGATFVSSSSTRMLRRALGFAATQASGLRQVFGTSAKSIQVGRAAESGVLAAELALGGFSAPDDAVLGDRGYLATLGQLGDLAAAQLPLSQQWLVTDVLLKQHASCFGTHAVIDALLAVRTECPPARINRIEVTVAPLLDTICNIPRATTALEGKFSFRFTAATTLMYGACGITEFTDDATQDAALIELAAKVGVVFDPSLNLQSARVAVILDDSTRITSVGDSSVVKPAQVRSQIARDKLLEMGVPVLGESGTRSLLAIIEDLPNGRPVADLSRALRSASAGSLSS